MNTQTTLSTIGALILLLVVIGVVSMLFMQPSIPNTGDTGTTTVQTTTVASSSESLINENPNANLNDDGPGHEMRDDHGGLLEPAHGDHSE